MLAGLLRSASSLGSLTISLQPAVLFEPVDLNRAFCGLAPGGLWLPVARGWPSAHSRGPSSCEPMALGCGEAGPAAPSGAPCWSRCLSEVGVAGWFRCPFSPAGWCPPHGGRGWPQEVGKRRLAPRAPGWLPTPELRWGRCPRGRRGAAVVNGAAPLRAGTDVTASFCGVITGGSGASGLRAAPRGKGRAAVSLPSPPHPGCPPPGQVGVRGWGRGPLCGKWGVPTRGRGPVGRPGPHDQPRLLQGPVMLLLLLAALLGTGLLLLLWARGRPGRAAGRSQRWRLLLGHSLVLGGLGWATSRQRRCLENQTKDVRQSQERCLLRLLKEAGDTEPGAWLEGHLWEATPQPGPAAVRPGSGRPSPGAVCRLGASAASLQAPGHYQQAWCHAPVQLVAGSNTCKAVQASPVVCQAAGLQCRALCHVWSIRSIHFQVLLSTGWQPCQGSLGLLHSGKQRGVTREQPGRVEPGSDPASFSPTDSNTFREHHPLKPGRLDKDGSRQPILHPGSLPGPWTLLQSCWALDAPLQVA